MAGGAGSLWWRALNQHQVTSNIEELGRGRFSADCNFQLVGSCCKWIILHLQYFAVLDTWITESFWDTYSIAASGLILHTTFCDPAYNVLLLLACYSAQFSVTVTATLTFRVSYAQTQLSFFVASRWKKWNMEKGDREWSELLNDLNAMEGAVHVAVERLTKLTGCDSVILYWQTFC